jgi:hypothetical protein
VLQYLEEEMIQRMTTYNSCKQWDFQRLKLVRLSLQRAAMSNEQPNSFFLAP